MCHQCFCYCRPTHAQVICVETGVWFIAVVITVCLFINLVLSVCSCL